MAVLPRLLVLLCFAATVAFGATALASPTFDAHAATETYLASIPAAQRAQSDAYFEGGYWIGLWNLLITAAVAIGLLRYGISAKMRDLGERLPWRWAKTFAYFTQYVLITTLVTAPWAYYTGFAREHAYGLATQSLGAWLGDQAKALALGVVLGGIAITVLYGVFRRAPRTWWIWGAVVALVLLSIAMALGPVYIAPMFNEYTPLADGPVRDAVLQMAHQNGVDASEVWMSDASAQSTRISANVAGMFGTERITLNDNLLKRCNPAEIQAVMGHELGHYVLGHVYEGMMFFGMMAVVMFAVLRAAFARFMRRLGPAWGVRGIDDPAGLPALSLIISIVGFVAAPLTNSYIRQNEAEADIFGLNAAREPDGFATVALKLADYRKLDPGPLEEMLMYDHPSGRTRIEMAMRFKAAITRGDGGP